MPRTRKETYVHAVVGELRARCHCPAPHLEEPREVGEEALEAESLALVGVAASLAWAVAAREVATGVSLVQD